MSDRATITATITALVGARQRVKELIAREDAIYEARVGPLKANLIKLDGMIGVKMDDEELQNVKTPYGTAYFSTLDSMKVMDREVFFAWVLDNRAVDVLTTAVSKDAIRERGELPPGVELSQIRKLNVRKS